MKRVLLLAASIAAVVFALASTSPASAGSVPPPAGCTVASINPDGSETLTCGAATVAPEPNTAASNATPAPSTSSAAVAPSYVGTVVTTAGKQKSPGYAVDLIRRGSWNLSAIMLDSQSKIPITFGVSVMSKSGVSIGMLKLPQPSPTPGANKLGTYGVFIETRI